MKFIIKITTKITIHFIVVFMFTGVLLVNAQQTKDTVMVKLVTLQSDFVNKIKAAGYTPTLKVPEIVMDNPRSFGNYDNETNILHIANWATLPPESKELFIEAAKSFNNGMSPATFFKLGIHQWVFIHEMGHWWRACRKQTAEPYADEIAANRIAIAYWKERDPAFFAFMSQWFQGVVANIPSPVPNGQTKQKFLKDNYATIDGPPYTWYQASMIIEASEEKPVLSFKQAVGIAGNAGGK